MKRFFKWAGIIAGGLVVLASVAHAIWSWRSDSQLRQRIAQAQSRGEPILLADFADAPVPDDQNAVPLVRAAAATIDAKSKAWNAYMALHNQLALPLAPHEAELITEITSASPKVADTLAEARQRPQVVWGVALTRPVLLVDNSWLGPQRTLATYLLAQSLLAHHRGDHVRSVGSVRLLHFHARTITESDSLVGMLVACGIAWMSTEAAIQIAPDLALTADAGVSTPAQRDDVKQLIAEFLNDKPFADNFRNAWFFERMSMVDTMRGMADGSIALVTRPNRQQARGNLIARYAMAPILNDNAVLGADYPGGLASASDAPDLPTFNARVPAWPLPNESNRYVFASILLPSFKRAADMRYRIVAEQRLAATALAIRLYVIDHGKWPQTIEDLVPDYVPAVPIDPLIAGQQPLRYRASDASRPVVYSVGMNGIDDGGIPIDVPTDPQEPLPDRGRQRDFVIDLVRQPRTPPAPPRVEKSGDLAPIEEDE